MGTKMYNMNHVICLSCRVVSKYASGVCVWRDVRVGGCLERRPACCVNLSLSLFRLVYFIFCLPEMFFFYLAHIYVLLSHLLTHTHTLSLSLSLSLVT